VARALLCRRESADKDNNGRGGSESAAVSTPNADSTTCESDITGRNLVAITLVHTDLDVNCIANLISRYLATKNRSKIATMLIFETKFLESAVWRALRSNKYALTILFAI